MKLALLLILAAGVEVAAVPTSAPFISDDAAKLLVPLVVSAIASAIASGFNAWLRAGKRRGKKASPAALALGAGINAVAFNFDQVGRQAKAAVKKDQP